MARGKALIGRFDFSHYTEHDAAAAVRAQPKPLKQRVVRDGHRVYYVVDANALLEHQSNQDQARPGHPTG